MAMDTTQADIFGALSAYLHDIGLDSLFTLGPDGTPSGWLWDQITKGIDTADQLAVAIESTDAFKQRYAIIGEMRARAAKGEPVHIPTIKDVRDYETTVSGMMKQAQLPPWFYDSYEDMQDLMRKDLSPAELEQRIAKGWTMVRDTAPSVRQAFADFYGVDGDAALAAFVLDPSRTANAVDRAARTAYTTGYGRTMGLSVDQQVAEAIAAMPKTEGGILQDLGEAAKMRSLANEGITETSDLTDSDLLKASALGDGEAMGNIERRMLTRQANERSSTGGALTTQQGVVGLRGS